MTKQQIIDSFAKHNIVLSPAGIWKFNTDGKKEPIVAFRVDNLPLDKYPDDNMFKLRIE